MGQNNKATKHTPPSLGRVGEGLQANLNSSPRGGREGAVFFFVLFFTLLYCHYVFYLYICLLKIFVSVDERFAE